MPDPGIAEVASLVAAQENIPQSPTNRRENLANEVRLLTNDAHFREGLRKHAEARDVDFGGFDRKVAGFGVDVDPATGARTLTVEEQQYKTSIETAKARLTEFFDKGYDGVGGQQAGLVDMIIEQAKRNPAMAAQVLTQGFNAQAFAERYLRDPAFIANLKNVLNESLEGNFDNSVLDAYDSWRSKDQAQQDAQDRLTEMQRRRDVSVGRLRPFERTATGAPRANAVNATNIDNLQNSSGQDAIDATLHQQNIARLEQELVTLDQEKTLANSLARMRPDQEIRDDITSIGNQITTAEAAYNANPTAQNRTSLESARRMRSQYQQELSDRQAAASARPLVDIDNRINAIKTNELPQERSELANKLGNAQRLKDLEEREGALGGNRESAEEDFAKAQSELRLATEEASKARREYESAKAVRLAAEKTLSERLTNAFGEAGNRTMNDILIEASKHQETALAKMKAEEKEQHAREALDALSARWQMPPRDVQRGPWWNRRTETHRPINKVQLNNDLDTLLNEGDRGLMRHIMQGRNNPTTNAPYTDAEINSLLEKEDFTKKIGPEAIKQLFAQRFLTGGFRREDINIIVRSQWGPGMLEAAARTNTDLQAGIRTVMEQGAFNRNGFSDRFGKIANEQPWLIYSLLGIPIAALRAMFGSAVDEPIRNQN